MDNKDLFERQKQLLDTFLLNGAITKDQYEKSLSVLKEKLLEKSDTDE